MRGEDLAEKRRRGRSTAIVLAATLAVVVLIALLVVVTRAAPQTGFLHTRRNLSLTGDRFSAYPDLAVSADGDRVAVVWVEGYDEYAGYWGDVYLRAASESGGGWGDKHLVYDGDGDACAKYKTAVAVSGTVAHVAYVVFDACAETEFTRLYYGKCFLTNLECQPSQQITFTRWVSSYITWVDVAVDEDENPHVAWAQYSTGGGDPGRIFYSKRSGSSWGSSELVYGTGDNNTPAIACAGDYAHLVWEDEDANAIFYRRRDLVSGSWDTKIQLYGISTSPPRDPDVAAGADGRVFVVWDLLYDDTPQFYSYALVYARSNDSGATFLEPVVSRKFREVGTDRTASEWAQFAEYRPTGNGYLQYLRPSVAINGDGWPAVVWHAGVITGVRYSYAVTGTSSSVTWSSPDVLAEGQSGAAAVGVGTLEDDDGQCLHVAYMEKKEGCAWEVYYDSDESSGYSYLYLPLVLRNH